MTTDEKETFIPLIRMGLRHTEIAYSTPKGKAACIFLGLEGCPFSNSEIEKIQLASQSPMALEEIREYFKDKPVTIKSGVNIPYFHYPDGLNGVIVECAVSHDSIRNRLAELTPNPSEIRTKPGFLQFLTTKR